MIKPLLLGLSLAVAALFLLIVGAVLFSTPGDLNLACLKGAYLDHCEGDVALNCGSGWLTLSKVTKTDCRNSELGAGVCVQKVVSSHHWASCEVPCDPRTYETHCSGYAVMRCAQYDSKPAFVAVQGCQQMDICTEHTRADGSRFAQCDHRPPEPQP